ncbi:MAG TPA: hypothetical protein VKS81_03950, partial [Bacteroidota bacterium]|nr:hypothetical protein [Bacteroidota bacterium]
VTSIKVGKDTVHDASAYTIITNNFITDHFDEYFGFKAAKGYLNDTGIVDRDAVIDYIGRIKTISAGVEGRIRVVSH